MPGFVAVVTDSTACLPRKLADHWGILVVQQQLRIGAHYGDDAQVSGGSLARLLHGQVPVRTEAPDPAAFVRAYQEALAQGASAIVSVHVSGALSRTCSVAREAARQIAIPVHVLDSRTVGMSLGYAALAAARIAQAGADVNRTLSVAADRVFGSSELLYVDTLRYLRRGGRVGAVAHLASSALSIKPLLIMRNGNMAPFDRCFGAERAIGRMVDEAARLADARRVDVAVEYVGTDGRVEDILAHLRTRLPNVGEAISATVSSVITAHVGPGAIGVTVSPSG